MPHATLINLCCILLLGSCCLWPVMQAKQKFCGKTLNEAMDLLCVHGYNIKLSPPAEKRVTDLHARQTVSNMDLDQATMSQQYDDVVETAAEKPPSYNIPSTFWLSPFLANFYGTLLASNRRRRDNGVYDECCRQPCTYSELAAYCRSA